MCFELDSVPPIAPISGAAPVRSEDVVLEAADGTRLAGFLALPVEGARVGVVVLPTYAASTASTRCSRSASRSAGTRRSRSTTSAAPPACRSGHRTGTEWRHGVRIGSAHAARAPRCDPALGANTVRARRRGRRGRRGRGRRGCGGDDRGDFGHTIFAVESGTADVVADGVAIRMVGPGDVVGEIAVLSSGRRTASVVATSPMRLISLFKRDVSALERHAPALQGASASCSTSTTAAQPAEGPPGRPLYDRPVPSVADDLGKVKLFSALSKRQLSRLARQVRVREFRPGVEVVSEGTMSGVGFFIIAGGEAAVSVEGTDVGRLGPGDHFGELALITEDARMATVTAVTRLTCHVIASWDFRKFAKENPDVCWALLQHTAGLLTSERSRRAKAALASG